jgi:glycine/D-amino acid oxidase-like deaminating enzyme
VRLTVVGQGLAGTLAALEAERRGRDFVVVDRESGAPATRAAAGLFNPLIGPRFTPDTDGWDRLLPFYRDWEQRLGVGLVHPLPLLRPWAGAKAGPQAFPKSAPGWSATARTEGVWVEGGGWVDLPALLDAARARWLAAGRLEERDWGRDEGRGKPVLWSGGMADLGGEVWGPVVAGRWQPVRGDVLTVRIPGLALDHGEVGPRFLLPLGQGLYRWGATHESDVADRAFRPGPRKDLEEALALRLGLGQPAPGFTVTGHAWGVRPASRSGVPLVEAHPDEPGWVLFNGFGGRGVSLVPRWLDRAWGCFR